MKLQLEINEELLNRIISVAYGDATLIDKIKVHFLASRNSEVMRLLTEYKITARAIGNLEKKDCPDEVLESIKINTGIEKRELLSPAIKFLYTLIYKPVLATAVVLVLAASITLFILFNSTSRNQYSEKQVQLAEKQVKQSLAIVSKVFNRATNRLENDILKEQVAKPVHEGVSTINELFRGG